MKREDYEYLIYCWKVANSRGDDDNEREFRKQIMKAEVDDAPRKPVVAPTETSVPAETAEAVAEVATPA